MLVFGLENIPRFLISTSLLACLNETAHLQCTKSMLSLKISHNSPYFLLVALRISPQFFCYYIIADPRICNWRIPLHQICDSLEQAQTSPSMVCTVYNENPPHALLKFRDAPIGTFGRAVLSSKLSVSREEDQEVEDLGIVEFATFVSIDNEEFRRLSTELEFIDHKVRVTLTNSQVIFSNILKECIVPEGRGGCIIGGIKNGENSEFIISLKPWHFYVQLAYRTKRFWMYKTSNGRGVIFAPLDLNARLEIFFPYLTM